MKPVRAHDLAVFVKNIIEKRKSNYIAPYELYKEIYESFGTSENTRKRYLRVLRELGFIKEHGTAQWELTIPKEYGALLPKR